MFNTVKVLSVPWLLQFYLWLINIIWTYLGGAYYEMVLSVHHLSIHPIRIHKSRMEGLRNTKFRSKIFPSWMWLPPFFGRNVPLNFHVTVHGVYRRNALRHWRWRM